VWPYLNNPVFLVFAFLTIVNIAWAISHYCSKYNQAKFDTELKQDMINRGMSADDFVKVLQASSKSIETSPAEYEHREAVESKA